MIRLLTLILLLFAFTPAQAQQVSPLSGLVSTSPPTGFTAQNFNYWCTNATPASGVCWPLLQIYDGTTRATVNSVNSGLNVSIASGASFTPDNSSTSYASIAVVAATFTPSSASNVVAMPSSSGLQLVIDNTGGNQVNFRMGTASAGTDPTSAGDAIQPGCFKEVTIGSNTFFSIVGIGGPSAVQLSRGNGQLQGGCDAAGLPIGPLSSPIPGFATMIGYNQSGNLVPFTGSAQGVYADVTTSSQLHTDIVAPTGSTGGAVPAKADYLGINVSGLLTGLTGNTSGLYIDTPNTSTLYAALTSPLAAQSGTGILIGDVHQYLGAANPFFVQGTVSAANSGVVTNPTAVIPLASTTSAYSAGNLMANNATAGSVVVQSFAIANAAGGAYITGGTVYINDGVSTGFANMTIQADLWRVAPTFATGDHTAYAPATQLNNFIGSLTCVLSANFGTTGLNTGGNIGNGGVIGNCQPTTGNFIAVALGTGTAIYVTLKAITASGTITTGGATAYTTWQVTN